MSKNRWMSAAMAALAVGVSVPLAAAASSDTTTVRAKLTGKAERGSKGDPDGSGTATVKVKGTQVCFTLTYKRVDALKGGHIHKGGPNANGPHAVELFNGKAKKSGCARTKLAKDIAEHPARYYVNLHNAKYPKGAIRGQLAK